MCVCERERERERERKCLHLQDGVVRMVELMILPRLRPSLETFSTLSHILTEVRELH